MPLLAVSLRILLTAVFAVTALVCGRRCVDRAPVSRRGRVNDAAHVLMSIEMVAMVWAWSSPDPAGIQIVVFSAGAAWFAIQATGVPLSRAGLVPSASMPVPSCGGHAPLSRTQCAHHAILLTMTVSMLLPVRTGRTMPGMASMPATGTAIGAVIGGYCLVTAIVWMVWTSLRARRDVRTITPYAAMTAAMGVMVLVS